mmetsp:Transcript_13340/g.27087  ORF Transcript_13340/g.27087 Transcript_13340/m.27087 type:complete len:532 (-) Transcript_13340:526-2121(-)
MWFARKGNEYVLPWFPESIASPAQSLNFPQAGNSIKLARPGVVVSNTNRHPKAIAQSRAFDGTGFGLLCSSSCIMLNFVVTPVAQPCPRRFRRSMSCGADGGRKFDWMTSVPGVVAPKLRVGRVADTWGWIATEEIEPGEGLMTVPYEYAIVPSGTSPDDTIIPQQYWEQLGRTWYFRLAVYLLFEEKIIGENSKWFGYLRSLPCASDVDSTLQFSDNDLKSLEYSLVEEISLSRKKAFNEALVSFRQATKSSLGGQVSDDDFLRAVQNAHSRAFKLPHFNTYGFLPCIDMFNHSSRCITEMNYDVVNNVFRVCVPRKGFNPLSHVCISYGERSNDDLLQFYGFVEHDNPADEYVFSKAWSFLEEQGVKAEARQEALLTTLGLSLRKDYRNRRDHIDEDLIACLRILLADPDGGDFQHALSWKVTPRKEWKSLSLENELQVWDLVVRWCHFELGNFSTTLEEDLRSLSTERNSRRRMIISFRCEKKKVLHSIVERLRHLSDVSSKVGRVITVLLSPSQTFVTLFTKDESEN